MFRCVLAEIFSLGGGHALSGGLTRAVAWMAAVVVAVALCLWTPWAVLLVAIVRVASIVEAGRHGKRGPAGGRWQWKLMFAFLFISYGFLAVTRVTALEAFKIPSEGMAPTLQIGDYVIGNKLSLYGSEPARGEVVVYRVDGVDFIGRVVAVGGDDVAVRGGALYLNGAAVPQRPIGDIEYVTADETLRRVTTMKAPAAVEELGGHRYRVLPGEGGYTDFPSEESGCRSSSVAPRFLGAALEPGRDASSCRVPKGTVFILGDNRGSSHDSRFRGAFPAASVRARVVGVWMSRHGGWFSRVGAIE